MLPLSLLSKNCSTDNRFDDKNWFKNNKISYEFANGDLTLPEKKTNEITIRKYKGHEALKNFLFNFFRKPANMFYLIVFALNFSFSLFPFFEPILWENSGSLIAFLTYFLLHCCIELYFDKPKNQIDKMINSQIAIRGKKKKGDTEKVEWKDLSIGDIVYLEKGETCPTDIILLDSGLTQEMESPDSCNFNRCENVCYIDTRNIDGRMNATMKKCPKLTKSYYTNQTKSFSEFRKRISGKIEIEPPKNFSHFYGFLKLKSEIESEQLSLINFIPRGAKILTSWVFGYTVYTGTDCKMVMNHSSLPHKSSIIEKLIEKLTFFSILLCFILTSINFIISVSKEVNRSEVYILDYIWNFLTYCYLIPINIYFTFRLITLIQKYTLEKKIRQTHKDSSFHINNAKILGNLDHVDYVLLDKTGTLTEKSFVLDSIYFSNKNYFVNYEFKENHYKTALNFNDFSPLKDSRISLDFDDNNDFLNRINNKTENSEFNKKSHIKKGRSEEKYSSTSINLLRKGKSSPNPLQVMKNENFEEEEKNQIDLENMEKVDMSPKFQEFNQIEDFEMFAKNNSEDLREVSKCLSLTHPRGLFRFSKKQELDNKREVYNYEDELLQSFCRSYGLGFDNCVLIENEHNYRNNSSTIKYYLRDTVNGKQFEYNLVGINEYSYERKRFSIVFQETENNDFKYVLYCKGKFDSMKNRLKLSSDQIRNYENMIKKYSEKGLRMLVYGRRVLDHDEVRRYFDHYTQYRGSIVSRQKDLELLADEMENNLNLVCIAALKERSRPDAINLVRMLKNSNKRKPKIWILTGDAYTNACNAGINFSLFDPQSLNNSLHFKDTNNDNLRFFIREVLSDIKKTIRDKCQKEAQQDDIYRNSDQNVNKDNKDDYFRKESSFNSKEKKLSILTKKEIDEYFSQKIIFINGESLSLILKDQYLRLNFIFILSLAQNVVGYNLTPDQKFEFVNIIKKKFLNQPTVLTVGDGYNDAIMMKASDISVEIHHDITESCHIADIQLQNLGCLDELLRVYGSNCTKNILFCVFLRFFQSFGFVFTLFFSNSLFYGKYYVNYENVFYFLILQTLDILIICFHDCSTTHLDNHAKKMFNTNFGKFYKISLLKFISIVFYSAISGCLTYLVSISYIMNAIEESNGHSYTAPAANAMIFLILAIVFEERILIFYAERKFGYAKILLHIVGLILALVIFFALSLDTNTFYFIMNNLYLAFFSLAMIFMIKYMFFAILDLSFSQVKKIFLKILKYQHVFEKSEGIELGNLVYKVFSENKNMIDRIIKEMINPDDVNFNNLIISKCTLEYSEIHLERKYRQSRMRKNDKQSKYYFLIFFIFSLSIFFYDIFVEDEESRSAISIIVLLAVIIIGVFINNPKQMQIYYYSPLLLLVAILISKIVSDNLTIKPHIIYVTIFLPMFFSWNYSMNFILIIFMNAVLTISSIIFLVSNVNKFSNSAYRWEIICYKSIVLLIVIVSVNCVKLYYFEKLRRNEFLAASQSDNNDQINHEIFSILLPKFVQDRVLTYDGSYMNDLRFQKEQKDVVIFFCYICDFEQLVRSQKEKIFSILHKFYLAIDKLCNKHGIQKIETVGNNYVACAGIEAYENALNQKKLKINTKYNRMIDFALEIMDEFSCKKYEIEYEIEDLKLKIGIHGGDVITDILGVHKIQFSLFGDPVNVTSRIACKAEPNSILISDYIYQKLNKDEYNFIESEIDAKGKGYLIVYKVSPTRKNSFPAISSNVSFASSSSKNLKKKRSASPPRLSPRAKTIREGKNNKKFINSRSKTINDPSQPNDDFQILIKKVKNPLVQSKIENIKLIKKTSSLSYTGENSIPSSNRESENDLQIEDDQNIDNDEKEEELLTYNRLLKIKKPCKNKKDFKKQKVNFFLKETKIIFAILILFYILQFVIDYLIQMRDFSENKSVSSSIKFFFFIFLFFPLFFGLEKIFHLFVMRIFMILLVFILIILEIIIMYFETDRLMLEINLALLFCPLFLLTNFSFLSFVEIILVNLVFLIAVIIVIIYFGLSYFENIIMYTLILLHITVRNFFPLRFHLKSFNKLKISEIKNAKQTEKLLQLMPTHAYDKLKSLSLEKNINNNAEELEKVTLLYADISGFTKLASTEKPKKIVHALRLLFAAFDRKCIANHVFKLYTIGDCYVVMGVENVSKRDYIQEAENVVNMATSMIDEIVKIRKDPSFISQEFDMRIGIHTGNIIAGVIGSDIVRYDIFGDAVFIANKLQEKSKEGEFLISEQTKNLLEKNNLYYFETMSLIKMEELKCNVQSYKLQRKSATSLSEKEK